MGFALDKVVPWGRSYDEYLAMFALTEADLTRHILGCGDGPAGFNAELTQRGGRIVSVDPIYVFDAPQINKRISETRETVMIQIRKNQKDYIWNAIASVEELERVRMSAMDTFLADYENGKNKGRYIEGELPALPFGNGKFDLALSSHFLFLYSMHLSAEFHLQALQEMLRVAREVRVFPLLALDGTPSSHLSFVTESLSSQGYKIEIKPVLYEFQRGGNEMLAVQSCF
jgi:SAM-dependent methyltransferase